MEIAKIVNGQVVEYPVSRADCEAAIIATMQAIITVEETRMVTVEEVVDIEGEDGTVTQETITREEAQTVEVEIESQREFPLPANLAGLDLSAHGFAVVEPTDPPEVEPGEVAERDGIEQVDGAWRWKWRVRPMNAEELAQAKADRREAVDARLAMAFAAGFMPATVPLAGKTLQTRDIEDRTNWLTSQAAYSAAVAAGQGSEEGAVFRTANNQTIVTTYQNGLLTLLAMAAWGKALMGHSWALKDEIAAAATFADLAGIDIEAGWLA